MSLLSSHRLHWGAHHELADHFSILVDHLMHPSASGATSPEAPAADDGDQPAGASSPPDARAHLDALGP
jgi:hypothetical protein